MASPYSTAELVHPAALARPAWPSSALFVGGALGAVHLAMYGYDLAHPDRFMNADRANERFMAVQGFVQALQSGGDVPGYLASRGIAGDWLPHALLYLAGGQYLIIAVQIALVLVSVLCVREMGMRLGLSEPRAAGAALLYGLLPHTLVLPHTLSSEALSVPLVVVSFALAMRGIAPAQQAWAGLAIGLSTLVRPVTMLWPPVYAAFAPATWRARAAYLLVALAPLAVWVGFIYQATGQLSTGPSGHNLAYNLNLRAERIVESMPAAERPVLPPGRNTMSLREYLGFAAEHPRAVLAHNVRDLLVLGFKPGIERLVLDYLALFPEERKAVQDSAAGWRAQVDQHGLARGLLEVFRKSPGLVSISAMSAALFAVLMALALLGAAAALRRGAPPVIRRQRLLLVAFVLYVVATAQVVDAAQSRHRAPAEFALCLLALAGWSLLARSSRSGRSP